MREAVKQEWKSFWQLPIAAAFGYSTAVLHNYGLGPFIKPLEAEFGWSRSSISAGFMIAGMIGALFSIPLGTAVDRVGPRIVAFIGIVVMTGGFALLGTVGKDIWQWYLVWIVIGIGNVFLQATVWTTAIATRFVASRGLAIAISLSGASITATLLPVFASWLIQSYGWRVGFVTIGAVWASVVLPILFFYFWSGKDKSGRTNGVANPAAPPVSAGERLGSAVATAGFYQLLLAGAFFTITATGLIIHFVPILVGSGANLLGAASIAALIGISSVIGRLSTGWLLDRFRPNLVGALVFVLPLFSCLLLLVAEGDAAAQTAAAVLFGFAVGAEIDVIAYLVSRRFGLGSYGSIFGAMVGAMQLGAAVGPLLAGVIYDGYGSYAPFLGGSAVILAISALALFLLKLPAVSSVSET